MMVWVLMKPNGDYYRAVNGLPLYYASRRAAEAAARAMRLENYVVHVHRVQD